MANPNVRLALRVHDECNGELSFPGRFFLNHVLRLLGDIIHLGSNLDSKLTRHHLGSDVFGSDICTWYVRVPILHATSRVARHISGVEAPVLH